MCIRLINPNGNIFFKKLFILYKMHVHLLKFVLHVNMFESDSNIICALTARIQIGTIWNTGRIRYD